MNLFGQRALTSLICMKSGGQNKFHCQSLQNSVVLSQETHDFFQIILQPCPSLLNSSPNPAQNLCISKTSVSDLFQTKQTLFDNCTPTVGSCARCPLLERRNQSDDVASGLEVSFIHHVKTTDSCPLNFTISLDVQSKLCHGENQFGQGQDLVIATELRTMKEAEGSIPLLCDW